MMMSVLRAIIKAKIHSIRYMFSRAYNLKRRSSKTASVLPVL